LFASVVILQPACPREKPTEGNEGNEESKDRCFGVLEEFCRAPHREHRDNAGPTWQGSLGARTAMSARFWLQIKFTRTRLSALLFARCLNRSTCIPLKSETRAVSRSPDTQGCFFEGISSVEENCRAPSPRRSKRRSCHPRRRDCPDRARGSSDRGRKSRG